MTGPSAAQTVPIRVGSRGPLGTAAPGQPTNLVGVERLLLTDAHLTLVGPADPLDPNRATRAESLLDHVARIGARPFGDLALVDLVEQHGLTGHGGAHVPAALKWRSALRSSGPLTVVANGAESEPVSGKDGTLLRQRPHLVLDGLALLAEALGADRAVLWLHGDDAGARDAVLWAIEERRSTLGSQHPVEVVSGPSHYLSGESSAIVRALSGGPALPTARRPVDPGAPTTLVHNVETLARLALLARGHAVPATVLLSVLTPTGRRVVEADRGTRLVDVLTGLGWPLDPPPAAVLLGGYGGQWATWEQVGRLTLDEGVMRAHGLSLGAGVVVPLPAGACGLTETAALTAYLASMSARQCGPCLFGLPSIADTLQRLAAGRAPAGELTRLHDDVRAVQGRGACHHPDGVTRLVASAVEVFGRDLAAHADGLVCRGSRRSVLPMPQDHR